MKVYIVISNARERNILGVLSSKKLACKMKKEFDEVWGENSCEIKKMPVEGIIYEKLIKQYPEESYKFEESYDELLKKARCFFHTLTELIDYCQELILRENASVGTFKIKRKNQEPFFLQMTRSTEIVSCVQGTIMHERKKYFVIEDFLANDWGLGD